MAKFLWMPTSTWSRNVVARSELSHFAEIAPDFVLSYLPHRGVPATRARGGRSHGRGQAGGWTALHCACPWSASQSHEDTPPQPAKAGPCLRGGRCRSTCWPARCCWASHASMRVVLLARARPAAHPPSRGCGCLLVCGPGPGPAHEHAHRSVSVPGAGSGVAGK